MPLTLRPWRRVSATIVGDTLHIVAAASTLRGVRVAEGVVLERFLAMPPDEAAGAITRLLDQLGRGGAMRGLLGAALVVPDSWCATRPIQMTTAAWPKARDEVLRSLDRLLPIPPDDALVGLLDVFPAEPGAAATGGVLIAVRRSIAQAWLDAFARAAGLPSHSIDVYSPHIAALGLGLQDSPQSEFLSPLGPGPDAQGERLRFAWGRPLAVGESARTSDEPWGRRLIYRAASATDDAQIGPQDLALGAALAPVVAAGSFCPLGGRVSPAPRRWIAPAAAAAVAAALFLSAGPVFNARLERGAARLAQEQTAVEAALGEAQAMRREAERSLRILTAGVATPTSNWRSALPALLEAQSALGERGFLYRVELGPEHLSMSGEVASATSALEALEASPRLSGARLLAPIQRSSATGLDVVEIRATRDREGGAG